VISWEDVVKLLILMAGWWILFYIFGVSTFRRIRELMGYK